MIAARRETDSLAELLHINEDPAEQVCAAGLDVQMRHAEHACTMCSLSPLPQAEAAPAPQTSSSRPLLIINIPEQEPAAMPQQVHFLRPRL